MQIRPYYHGTVDILSRYSGYRLYYHGTVNTGYTITVQWIPVILSRYSGYRLYGIH